MVKSDNNLYSEVLVATTWACNLNCSYCFLKNSRNHYEPPMSAATARRVISVLDNAMTDVENICIHIYGGEPLTNLTALNALVEAAGSKIGNRFTFAITTNGTILTEQIINLLNQGNFKVILSVDGPPDIHNACRKTLTGMPTHAKVVKFLTSLKEHTNCWVRGSAVVRNNWRLLEATDYLRDLPVDAIKAQAVRVPSFDSHALLEAEKKIYFNDLEKIGEKIIQELEKGIRPIDDRFSSRVLQLLKGKSRDFFCGAGRTTFGILPDGSVSPCVLIEDKEQRLGHIDMHHDVWIEAGKVWRTQHQNREECKMCAALPLCGGGCPAILPICGGDECEITRKNCEIAQKIFQHFESCPEKLLLLAGIN